MRTLITTLLLLVLAAIPASAQTWSNSSSYNEGPTDIAQTFVMDVSALGAPTIRQDLTECVTPVITLTDATAHLLIYDCPNATTTGAISTECVQLADLPDADGVLSRAQSLSKGFLHVNVIDAGATTGSLTSDCGVVRNKTFDGSSWVTNYGSVSGSEMQVACADGTLKGAGYDSDNDCYAEVCLNYNWSAEIGGGTYPLYDQPTTVGGNSWTMTCTGDGTAEPGGAVIDGNPVEELICLTAGEEIKMYAMADAMLGQSRACDGGTAYLPSGAYQNAGCGQQADGTNNACPVLPTFPYHSQRRIQAMRGVKWIGSGAQWVDPASNGRDSTKAIWVDDHDKDGSSPGGTHDLDRNDDGGQFWGWSHTSGPWKGENWCYTNDDTEPITCGLIPDDVNGSKGKVGFGTYATRGVMLGTLDADIGYVCVENDITKTGTCSNNRRIRCDTNTPTPRTNGQSAACSKA